jgi:hypothetical protein
MHLLISDYSLEGNARVSRQELTGDICDALTAAHIAAFDLSRQFLRDLQQSCKSPDHGLPAELIPSVQVETTEFGYDVSAPHPLFPNTKAILYRISVVD